MIVRVLIAISAIFGANAGIASEEPPSSFPNHLVAGGDRLFFFADDGIHGQELWMWTPDPANPANGKCELVADLEPGANGTVCTNTHILHGWVYIGIESKERGAEVWMWNEKSHRLEQAQVAGLPAGWHVFGMLCSIDSQVVLTASDSKTAIGLCVGPAGENAFRFLPESMSTNLPGHMPYALISKTTALFGTRDGILRSDGTPEGTFSFNTPEWSDKRSGIREMIAINGKALFLNGYASLGEELWASDGTAEGTFLLKDIHPGPNGSVINMFYRHKNYVLFQADDGAHGIELWRSDGTPEGTFLLCDIAPGLASSDPHYFCSVGEWIYFVANDGAHGKEIWRTNGTREGTHLVVDLMPGQASSGPWSLTAYQGKLFFCANSPDFGEEVFFTDGTGEGTRVLKDVAPGPGWSGPDNLCVFGDYLFFSCNDGIHGEELWISDGTVNGTRLAADIRRSTHALNPSSSPSELTAAGDLLLLVVETPEYDNTLWQSDGTEHGTHPVINMAQFSIGTGPRCLTASADLVFFSAQDDEHGREPWVYDPNGRDCRILKDLCPGPCASNPDHFLSIDQWMYFSADDGIHGRRVWRSSASGDNIEMLNLAPDEGAGLNVVQIFTLLGRIYCYAREDAASASLWRVDANHGLVERLVRFNTPLPPWDPNEPHVFPVLDGEAPMPEDLVEELYLVGTICPYNPEPRAPDTAVLEDKLLFPAHTNAYGAELWRTDGTRAGTTLVCDIFLGRASSSPHCLRVSCGKLYFIAEFPVEGMVVGESNGTPQGTRFIRPFNRGANIYFPSITASGMERLGENQLILASIFPIAGTPGNMQLGMIRCTEGEEEYVHFGTIRAGNSGAWPRQFTEVNGCIFFTADDGIHGEELWLTDGEKEVRMVRDILPAVIISAR